MSAIVLRPLPTPDSLADDWRALETRADHSFFQSWTWTGCAAARFGDAWMLRAAGDGLALFNRQRHWAADRLFLAESGDPAWDAAYIEHNGPLLADPALLQPCLAALLRGAGPRGRVVRLSGVDDAHLAAARAVGVVRLRRSQPAPYVDLAALPAGPDGFLASLSANTRYQLRRSDRAYAAAGPVAVQRAADAAQALDWLDALAVLHRAGWAARGKPGAFANPAFRRFHAALLARALPRGEADLLRIAAGPRIIGYLYNFRHRGRAYAYQSGFDYAAAGPHEKPGLTCHHAAIALARQEGARVYDFLAGDGRYKTSLANAVTTLHWLDMAPRGSLAGLALQVRLRASIWRNKASWPWLVSSQPNRSA